MSSLAFAGMLMMFKVGHATGHDSGFAKGTQIGYLERYKEDVAFTASHPCQIPAYRYQPQPRDFGYPYNQPAPLRPMNR